LHHVAERRHDLLGKARLFSEVLLSTRIADKDTPLMQAS
jgi:hypothetical protein